MPLQKTSSPKRPPDLPISDPAAYHLRLLEDENPSENFTLGRSELFRHWEQMKPLMTWVEKHQQQFPRQKIKLLFIGPGSGLEEPISVLSYLQHWIHSTGKELSESFDVCFIDIQLKESFQPNYDLMPAQKKSRHPYFEVHPNVQQLIQTALNSSKSQFLTPIENATQQMQIHDHADIIFCNNVLVHLGFTDATQDSENTTSRYPSPFKPFRCGAKIYSEDFSKFFEAIEGIVQIVKPGGLLFMGIDGRGHDVVSRLRTAQAIAQGRSTDNMISAKELADNIVRNSQFVQRYYHEKREGDPTGLYRRK